MNNAHKESLLCNIYGCSYHKAMNYFMELISCFCVGVIFYNYVIFNEYRIQIKNMKFYNRLNRC